MVSLLLVIGCKEEDGVDDPSDFDQAGVDRLAVFDLKGLSCRFEYRGEFSSNMLSMVACLR